jgi:hypothetical protein
VCGKDIIQMDDPGFNFGGPKLPHFLMELGDSKAY